MNSFESVSDIYLQFSQSLPVKQFWKEETKYYNRNKRK